MNLNGLKTIPLAVLGLVALAAGAHACGGSFDVPKDHFDGVDEFGYVSHWEKLTDMDIGEDQRLPLVIGFSSKRQTSSPYLGSGWVMPLIESYMVQTGENTFEIMKPTGYTSGFGRDPENPGAIGGVKGWKGEIGSNTIKVWAPCGWSLTYTMGRLTEMGTPKGRRIIVKRDAGGVVEDVTMDGKVLVKVLRGLGGKVEGVEVEGRKFAIALDEKPRVQSVDGKNLVAGKELALGRVGSEDGENRVYTYGLTENLRPRLTVAGQGKAPREIVWNPETRLIHSDGDWTYDIEPGAENFANAAIGRTNAKGQREFWHYDAAKGEEVVQTIDGVRKVTSWFTSGKLAGALRKKEQIANGKVRTTYQAVFDEAGNLIRTTTENVEVRYLRPRKPQLISVNRVPLYIYEYDSDGNFVSLSVTKPQSIQRN